MSNLKNKRSQSAVKRRDILCNSVVAGHKTQIFNHLQNENKLVNQVDLMSTIKDIMR